MKKLALILLALTVLLPQTAWAKRAEILLIPTRIVMENNDRYTTVIIRNAGDGVGNLSVDMIDMTMGEDGRVNQLEEGKTDPYSAIPFLRVSPRSITIKPGESQNVRIMLRKPEGLAAGEYRSHLKVKIEDDDARDPADTTPADTALSVAVKAKLALTIPVIVRTGDMSLNVKIDSPKIVRDDKGVPAVEMVLLREGNRSVMGNFTFNYAPPGSESKLVKTFPGIPVYRSTDRRKVSITLDDLPAGVDLNKGKLGIVYTAQEKEGGMKLAESTIDLTAAK